MTEPLTDPREHLEAIRSLMERARAYRHPPAPVGVVAGGCALAGGVFTHGTLAAAPADLARLATVWGAVFAVSFAAVVVFTSRAARREGIPFWSPLARDVVHALWPPLVAALALTVPLVRADRLDLVAAVWMLLYGVGGIAAGAYASRVVRALGLAFLAAGVAQVALALPPGPVVAATFGGFHLVYGAVVALAPARR